MRRRMSSIASKNLMAISGLFLCSFLIVHLLGNLALLLPESIARPRFNQYAQFLSELAVIKIAAYVTYFAIALHAVVAALLTLRNRESAGERYAYSDPAASSPWYTRFMGVLGAILLLFIVIHMRDFWYPYKFGEAVAIDPDGSKDLYGIVSVALARWWYAMFYVVAMMALGFHLQRGLYNGCRSLGLHHPVYSRWVKRASQLFAFTMTIGFTAVTVYMYVSHSITR